MDSRQKCSPFRKPRNAFFFFCTRDIMHTSALCCQAPFSILVTVEALELAGDHFLPMDVTGKPSCL